MPRRIAIVGAGFSGTVLAAQLLRQSAKAMSIHLFERSGVVGRGTAYAEREWPYLLNVPAGRLSVEPRDPQQFLRFARRTRPHADAEDFLPRELYGDYLQEVLRRAETEALPAVKLTCTFAEVTCIRRRDRGFELDIATGEKVLADDVVLSVGGPTSPIPPWARGALNHPSFHSDAWDHPRVFDSSKHVVFVGSGLTMVDVALSLSDSAANSPSIISISRHGLLPLPQTVFGSAVLPTVAVQTMQHARSIRELMTIIRALVRDHAEQGGDWREVITLVRHAVPTLWRELPAAERRRFVRHARSYWEVHRHRMPPQLSFRLDSLRAAGKLQVTAGRVIDVAPQATKLKVSWRPRGAASVSTIEADAVINATGPNSSVRETLDPLLRALLDSGLICADELELGVRTTSEGRCMSADGTAVAQLYYLGPMLRADFWEATAVTELREHAECMARHLAGS